jgi:hypothetical protein
MDGVPLATSFAVCFAFIENPILRGAGESSMRYADVFHTSQWCSGDLPPRAPGFPSFRVKRSKTRKAAVFMKQKFDAQRLITGDRDFTA